jgi:hypothetical protein
MWTIALIVVLTAAAGIVILAGKAAGDRRRRRAMTALADRLGLRYTRREGHILDQLGGLYVLQQGHSGRAIHVLQGRQEGQRLWVFDYRYEAGMGIDRCTRDVSMVVWRLDDRAPRASLMGRTDEPFDRLGRFGNYVRLNPDDPAFTRVFRVYAEDAAAGAALLTAPVRASLLRCGRVDWELAGEFLVFFREGTLEVGPLRRLIRRSATCGQRLHSLPARPD